MAMDKIVGVDLLVAAESTDKTGKLHKLRVVQWIINGKPSYVRLEKRKFEVGPNGREKSKAEGFSIKDLETLRPHWGKIIALLKSPPALAQKLQGTAARAGR